MRALSSRAHQGFTGGGYGSPATGRGRLGPVRLGKEDPLRVVRIGAFLGAIATIVLAGYALGRLATANPFDVSGVDPTSPPPAAETSIPTADAPGHDLADLLRYPGSVRIAYGTETGQRLREIRVEYAVRAELDAVRAFYRDVFATRGWVVVDAQYEIGVWTFFVVQGGREAIVKLTEQGPNVHVALTHHEPVDGAPTPAPVEPPDDDGGSDDDGGDGDAGGPDDGADDGPGDDGGGGDDADGDDVEDDDPTED